MHNQPDTLSIVIKTAREKADITIEALAEKADITERYLYRIENEGKTEMFLFTTYTLRYSVRLIIRLPAHPPALEND